MDLARGRGSNVALIRDGDALKGFAGWVELGAADGEFYGSPFVAGDRQAADALIDHLEQRASSLGVAWIRVSCWPEERAKAEALEARGFRPAFDFIHLSLEVGAPNIDATVPRGIWTVSTEDVDHAAIAELGNLCFAGVANAPPLGPGEVRDIWTSPTLCARMTQLWGDTKGRLLAFLTADQDGTIDAVAVHPDAQRQGIARAMLLNAYNAAVSEEVPRLRVVIADHNEPSLALHRAVGFAEDERCVVWQL